MAQSMMNSIIIHYYKTHIASIQNINIKAESINRMANLAVLSVLPFSFSTKFKFLTTSRKTRRQRFHALSFFLYKFMLVWVNQWFPSRPLYFYFSFREFIEYLVYKICFPYIIKTYNDPTYANFYHFSINISDTKHWQISFCTFLQLWRSFVWFR